jgi:hypothetical protein
MAVFIGVFAIPLVTRRFEKRPGSNSSLSARFSIFRVHESLPCAIFLFDYITRDFWAWTYCSPTDGRTVVHSYSADECLLSRSRGVRVVGLFRWRNQARPEMVFDQFQVVRPSTNLAQGSLSAGAFSILKHDESRSGGLNPKEQLASRAESALHSPSAWG